MLSFLPLIEKLIGGIFKVLPFLAAYKAGGDAQKKRQAELAVKRAEKRRRIEEKNRKKSDAEILKELDSSARDD